MIDYLQEENRVLRAGLRGKRLRLSDDDRRRLAVKAQALGREALAQIASVATPATLLRWYRCPSCPKTQTERQGRILEAFSKLAGTSRRGTGSAIGDPEQTSPADHPFRPTGAPPNSYAASRW